MGRVFLSGLTAALLLSGCREGPAPFSLPDDNHVSGTGQLTYNLKQDHSPTFNPAGDSLVYEAGGFVGVPAGDGILLGIARTGGVAKLIMPRAQLNVTKQPRLSAPIFSPDGKALAFFDLDYRTFNADAIVCPFGINNQIDTAFTTVFLMGAKIRVRDVLDKTDADNSSVNVTFPGGFFNQNNYPAGQTTAYPHLRLFEREGLPFYRGSFSPDGTRLVFSDGLQLRLWTVGQSTTTVIPNTDDGILPAWSPDGNTIAFSRHPRTPTQTVGCSVVQNGVFLPVATISKTIYTQADRKNIQLFTIKPDGSGVKALGLGDSPAWLSNSAVVAGRDGNLARIDVNSGQATTIANTSEGYEAAVSKDGRFLAFARRATLNNTETQANYNIWVVAF